MTRAPSQRITRFSARQSPKNVPGCDDWSAWRVASRLATLSSSTSTQSLAIHWPSGRPDFRIAAISCSFRWSTTAFVGASSIRGRPPPAAAAALPPPPAAPPPPLARVAQ